MLSDHCGVAGKYIKYINLYVYFTFMYVKIMLGLNRFIVYKPLINTFFSGGSNVCTVRQWCSIEMPEIEP